MSSHSPAGLQAALIYAEAGWFVFPIFPVITVDGRRVCGCGWADCDPTNAGKHPARAGGDAPNPRWGSTTDPAKIRAYWAEVPGANVGVDCEASGLVVLDPDVRELELETIDGVHNLRRWCQEYRPSVLVEPDDEVWATQTQLTPSGGQHLVFQAGEHRIRSGNWRDMDRRKWKVAPQGVDLKAVGGMFVVSPSEHRLGGRYRWVDDLFDSDRVLALPEWLAKHLPVHGERSDPVTDSSVSGDFETRVPEGERHHALVSLTGSLRRRGLTAEEILPTVHAFNENRCDPPGSEASVEELVRDICGRYDPAPGVPEWGRDLASRANGHAEPDDVPCLPSDFWESRTWHRYIRDLARARCVSPDALLGAALAQVALRTSHKVTLPGIIGGPAPLNVMHAIAIESGMGKGAATDVARLTFGGAVEPFLRTVVLGSGEGMAHAYFSDVRVDDGKGRPRTETKRYYEGVLFDVDEGESLIRLLQRSGQTTGEDLRSGWSGKRLGRFYADRDKRREVEPMSYRLVVLMGIQPRAAGPLLDQDAGGLPQRVLWFTGYDLDAPEWAEEPPFTPWVPPALSEPVEVETAIRREIRDHHRRRQRREVTVERFDHHRNLVKLKTAALLAVLDGRGVVQGEDWQLAEMVVSTSDRVRASMLKEIGKDAKDRQRASDKKYVNRSQEVKRAGDATVRVAQGIRRRVEVNGPMTRSEIRRRASSRDRQYVTGALEHACAQGWVQEREDGRYGPS